MSVCNELASWRDTASTAMAAGLRAAWHPASSMPAMARHGSRWQAARGGGSLQKVAARMEATGGSAVAAGRRAGTRAANGMHRR